MVRLYRLPRLWWLGMLLALVVGARITAWGAPAAGQNAATPAATLQNAWTLTQQLGRYRFTSTIEQTTNPTPSLRNVGRGPSQETLYLEGKSDLPNQQALLTLWQGDGSVLDPTQAVELRFAGGRAFTRRAGSDWQPAPDYNDFTPTQRDPLAFLRAINNVTPVTPDLTIHHPLSTIHHQHFTFDLDAATFAEQMRAELETGLRRRGELPPGVRINVNEVYATMMGRGEIWIDADGLPRRLVVRLTMLAAGNGDESTVTLKTDFGGFDRSQLTAPTSWLTRSAAWVGLPTQAQGWRDLGVMGALLLGFSLLALLLVRYRQVRWVHGGIVVTMILAMVVTPLLQSQRVQAFADRMAERSQPLPDQQGSAAAGDDDEFASALDREATADQTAQVESVVARPQPVVYNAPAQQSAATPSLDSDGDGLSDSAEADYGSSPTDNDSDDDGLTDGQEGLALGTDPTAADSDNDLLSDFVEVTGAGMAGRYSDPRNPDTNGDGLTDGMDCPERSNLITDTVRPACGDTDGDSLPNLFDDDNDNDLVPDGVDLSPDHALGSAAQAFHGNNPLELSVNGLAANEPVYIDLQLRPVDPAHLTYALNVLDWPSGDTRGQIQRRLNTTFKTTANPDLRADDLQADNGDVRLAPMLSIRIPKQAGSYGNLPVKPNAPAITATTPITDWVRAIQTDTLKAYNMSVRMYDENTLELLAPVYMQTDQTGGGRVAFSSHLLYRPNSSGWGAAQEVRLLWVVQMLTDLCVDPAQEGEAFCNNPANRRDHAT